jgi:hypothetical protein
MCGILLQSMLPIKEDQWIKLILSKILEQSRKIHAPSRIVHAIQTPWESQRPLSLPTDSGVQSFVHMHASALPLMPMWSWNQKYRDQAQADTRIQGHT